MVSMRRNIAIANVRRSERTIRQQLAYWRERQAKNDADRKRLGLEPVEA
jgi:hypothetical protein